MPMSNTKWNSILTKLNTKRTDASFSSISHTFSGYIKQSDIDALRNGTLDILTTYGYTDLEEALNNVGYIYATWKTWSRNWISEVSLDEIEDILDSMSKTIVNPTIQESLRKYGTDNTVPRTILEAYQNALSSTAIFSPGAGQNVEWWSAGDTGTYVFVWLKKYYSKFDVSSYTYGKAILQLSRDYKSALVGGGWANPGAYPPQDNPFSIYATLLNGSAENYWNTGGTLVATFNYCPLGGEITYHDVTALINSGGVLDFLANTPLLPQGLGQSYWQPITAVLQLFSHT